MLDCKRLDAEHFWTFSAGCNLANCKGCLQTRFLLLKPVFCVKPDTLHIRSFEQIKLSLPLLDLKVKLVSKPCCFQTFYVASRSLSLKENPFILSVHVKVFWQTDAWGQHQRHKLVGAYSSEWLWVSLNAACGPTTVVKRLFAGVDYGSGIKGVFDHWRHSFTVRPDTL